MVDPVLCLIDALSQHEYKEDQPCQPNWERSCVGTWFPEPSITDNTYREDSEGTVSWLTRSTLDIAKEYRGFLNRNLAVLPEGCRGDIYHHLRNEQHFRDGFFELVVARTLQELGASVECEPENPKDGTKVDFVASFPDKTIFVEAVSPGLDKELGETYSREAPLTKLIEENVPPGWTADIRELPNTGPSDSKRRIKDFLRKEMRIPPPAHDDEEVEVEGAFEQGGLRVILFPQSRHSLSPDVKVALPKAIGYCPDDKRALRVAVRRKYRQLRNLDGTSFVALNMSSTTSRREDLDQALLGTTVSQRDQRGEEVGRYFQRDGLFAGGEGEPTISGVLAFPEVSVSRCDDPVLYIHPRFDEDIPATIKNLEIRRAPNTGAAVCVQQASRTDLLQNIGFLESRR